MSKTSDTGKPSITIITSVYNCESFLEESILSVINQTYNPLQYIIVDGNSSDGSVDIIKKYSDRIQYWVSEKDAGIYDAWNKALTRATGEWICFIGADDFFVSSTVLDDIAPCLQELKRNGVTLAYGRVNQITMDKSTVIDSLGEEWALCKNEFSKRMTLAHCAAFHHKSLFEVYGNFNATFKIAGDYEFLLRAYNKDHNFAGFIDVPVVSMRTGGISGSLKNRLRLANETELARTLNGYKDFSLSIFLWKLRIRGYDLIKMIIGTKLANRFADLYRGATGKKKRWSV